MSGEMIARAAVIAALRGDEALSALVNSIDDGEPAKASVPWLRIGEASTTGWGARGVEGIALRLTLQLAVRGDEEAAVGAIIDRMGAVLAELPADLDEGWRITSLRRERARLSRRHNEWRATGDLMLRLARLG